MASFSHTFPMICYHREEVDDRQRALLLEEGKILADGPVSPRTHAAARLQLTYLTQNKVDLESKVAGMQARSKSIRLQVRADG